MHSSCDRCFVPQYSGRMRNDGRTCVATRGHGLRRPGPQPLFSFFRISAYAHSLAIGHSWHGLGKPSTAQTGLWTTRMLGWARSSIRGVKHMGMPAMSLSLCSNLSNLTCHLVARTGLAPEPKDLGELRKSKRKTREISQSGIAAADQEPCAPLLVVSCSWFPSTDTGTPSLLNGR
jgi:hypothetical protein